MFSISLQSNREVHWHHQKMLALKVAIIFFVVVAAVAALLLKLDPNVAFVLNS